LELENRRSNPHLVSVKELRLINFLAVDESSVAALRVI
jgi:hypothetical protein